MNFIHERLTSEMLIFLICLFLSVGAETLDKCGFEKVIITGIMKNFTAARAYCKTLGLNLPRIANKEQNKCISDEAALKNIYYYWIDGSDIQTKGIWLNSDNNKLKYYNWMKGEPNNVGGNEHCILIYYFYYGKWRDYNCNYKYSIICVSNINTAASSNISVKASLHTLSFSWTKPKGSVDVNRKTYYLATLFKYPSTKISQNVSETFVEFTNLEMCSKYCLEIVAVNEGGQSESSGQTCSYTLAATPGSVIINGVWRGLSSLNNLISWTYSGNNHCPIYYKVEYGLKYKTFTHIVETKDKHIVLKDLDRNMLYKVRVKAETKAKVEKDLQYGPYSEIVYFYSGKDKPTIEDYREDIYSSKRQFNISWNLDSPSVGSVFEFIVIMKNSPKSCLTVVNLVCSSCLSQYNKVNLKDEDKVKRKSLLNCQKTETIEYKNNENHFSVSVNLSELSRASLQEIYAINLAGLHKVRSKAVYYKEESLGLCKVSDIESGPLTKRNITWKYSGKKDSIYYRVEFQVKHTKEIFFKTTNDTSIIVDNLEKNLIYQVKVRAERGSIVKCNIEEGEYSDTVEFFTGKLNIKLADVRTYLYPPRKKLEVWWSLEGAASGSVQSFLVRVNNTEDTCLSSIIFDFQPSTDIIKQTLASQHLIKRWQSLSKCTQSLKKYFSIHREDFSGTITSSGVLDNHTLSIYGLNVLGIHKLYEELLAQ